MYSREVLACAGNACGAVSFKNEKGCYTVGNISSKKVEISVQSERFTLQRGEKRVLMSNGHCVSKLDGRITAKYAKKERRSKKRRGFHAAVRDVARAKRIERTLKQPASKTERTWMMCNKTPYKSISVAYRHMRDELWVTKGWRIIPKDNCVILATGLLNRTVYYYAKRGRYVWNGNVAGCVGRVEKFEYVLHDGNESGCQDSAARVLFKKKNLGTHTTIHNLEI